MADTPDSLGAFRQFAALERGVLVVSVAMFAFSLAFQMTGRYIPEYLTALGASAGVVGLYGSVGNLVSAVYPYPGGRLSDRVGSRRALTLFGALSTFGFLVWWAAPLLATPTIPAWLWIFLGLFLTQAWKSLGLGATFAIVKQSVTQDRLATGFASTETFRRVGFLLGPLLAAAVLALTAGFTAGFRWILLVGAAFALVATFGQHLLYDASRDSLGKSFSGVSAVLDDLRGLPSELRRLLVADTLVRFGNGMVYVFFVLVVTDLRSVSLTVFGVTLAPAAFFGVLLAVEMAVALLSMLPVARLADRVGLTPVVALGFAVYAVFPVLVVFAPADQWVFVALFAFSGLRFAGLPAHKALIVGPAARDESGSVTGAYYLVRNVAVVPSALLGGVLYDRSPVLAFTVASVVGAVGVLYFLARGERPLR
ncbi:MFS transporter [Salarchaeum sp. JOR-1]|uniref:MFS transporter n=1 Tax=Salarchaeum sp. JOR-1 TaxID=2599399 RepID=UPI00119896CC|nr:MFS transporter [Salarchaeum sp. JOR-1]QDX41732.1 MFS transporter [Salarchaeum sp. JOR-1]